MNVTIHWIDAETGEEFETNDCTIADYIRDNATAPAQWVIREDIKINGVFVTHYRGVRCEITKRR